MLNTILRGLGFDVEPDPTPVDVRSFEAIAGVLDVMTLDAARYLAVFAWLLQRAAHVDHRLSKADCDRLERLIIRSGGVPRDHAWIVMDMATSQGLKARATQDATIVRAFEQLASPVQKLALIECLFGAAVLGGTSLDRDIRRIASEMAIPAADADAIHDRCHRELATPTRRRRETSG